MKVDAHQHFWNFDPEKDAWITDEMKVIRKDFLPEDLKTELDQNEMDGSVVVQAAPTEEESRFLLDLAYKNNFIKGVVGWTDLTADHVEERLQDYRNKNKLKGFRHLIQDEPDEEYLLRDDFCRGISLLKTYHYTYDILVFPKQLPATIKFVERFPDQKFVIDHIAKPFIRKGELEPWATQMKEIAQHPKAFCKLSGMITEANWKEWTEAEMKPYLDVVFEAFGAERVMFGSDWPVCLVAGTYSSVKQMITNYIRDCSPRQQRAVMGENAVKFYQL